MKTTALITAVAFLPAMAFADTPPAPPQSPASAAETVTCDTLDLTLYFQDESAELTDEAKAVIENMGDRLSGCAVTEIDARALSEDGDVSLASARAEAVEDAMIHAGIEPAASTTDIVMRRQSGQGAPILARRVELTIKAIRAYSS